MINEDLMHTFQEDRNVQLSVFCFPFGIFCFPPTEGFIKVPELGEGKQEKDECGGDEGGTKGEVPKTIGTNGRASEEESIRQKGTVGNLGIGILNGGVPCQHNL